MRWLMVLALLGCGGGAAGNTLESGSAASTAASTATSPEESAEETTAEAAGSAREQTREQTLEPIDPFTAWLDTMRLEEEEALLAAPTVPEGYRERSGDALTTWTSPDQRHVITRHDHGVWVSARVVFEDPPENMQPRLVPALHGRRWPYHALVFEGRDTVVPVRKSGALRLHVPLLQVGTGTLADTARLVHMTDCNVVADEGCMAFGAPDDLRQAPLADIPSDFRLLSESVGTSQRNLEWEEARVDPELLFQFAEVGEQCVSRFSLRSGSQTHTSIELQERNCANEYELTAKVSPLGNRQLVHVSLDWKHYFRIHQRSGRAIGAPIGYTITVDAPHGPAPPLEPIVRGNRLVGLVLFAGGSLVFDLDEPVGRYYPRCEPRVPDPNYDDDEGPPHVHAVSGRLYEIRESDAAKCVANRAWRNEE